jgi:hypothetical protein
MALISNLANYDSNFTFNFSSHDNIDNIDIASLRKAISDNFKLIEENLNELKLKNNI